MRSDELNLRLRQNKGRHLWPNLRRLLEVIIDRELGDEDLVGLPETDALKDAFYQRLRSGDSVVRFSWRPVHRQGVWLTVDQIRARNPELDVVLLHVHDTFVGAIRVKVREALGDPRRVWGAVKNDLCLMTHGANDGFCLEFNHLSTGDLYELSTWGVFSYLPGDDSFVRQVAAVIPEVRALLQKHLEDNFGELLPYVFLGSYVWPWFEEQFNSGTDAARRLCGLYIGMLETELARNDKETSNLIGVEFLEWLMNPGRESIRAVLPRRLMEELERMEGA